MLYFNKIVNNTGKDTLEAASLEAGDLLGVHTVKC